LGGNKGHPLGVVSNFCSPSYITQVDVAAAVFPCPSKPFFLLEIYHLPSRVKKEDIAGIHQRIPDC